MIFEEYEDDIRSHAEREYPLESVGLIVKGIGYVPCRNHHREPEKSFRLSPKDIITYGDDIRAVVHSHPDGPNYPSESDMRSQENLGVPFGIYVSGDTRETERLFWWGADCPKQPLIGRYFRHGISDCYELIRDWWEFEYREKLINVPRSWEWWNEEEENPDLYKAFLGPAGFEAMPLHGTKLIKGDIILFTIQSTVTNHAGVVLGDGTLLHHLSGVKGYDQSAISTRQPVARWWNYASSVARRKKQ